MIDAVSQPLIVADVVMLTVADGGRRRGIAIETDSRYMPHLVVDDRTNRVAKTDMNNVSTEHYIGVLFRPALTMSDTQTGSGRYPLVLMYFPRVDYSTLVPDVTFTVREGGRIVGHGVVVADGTGSDSCSTQTGG